MTEISLTEDAADELVEYLFSDGYPSKFEDALYIGPKAGEIVAAVERFCTGDSVSNEPNGTIVQRRTTESRELLEDRSDIETIFGDYLEEEFELDQSYDYVACIPPTRAWAPLSQEEKAAIANNFGQVTIDDESIESDELYLTRTMRDISMGGRGIFLTERSLIDTNATATLWDRHYYRIERLNSVTAAHRPSATNEHVLMTITNNSEDWERAPTSYDAKSQEEELDANLTELEQPFTAQAVMTEDVEEFTTGSAVADVYIEMMLADFDAAPVVRKRSEKGDTVHIGYVSRGQLRTVSGATVGDQYRTFTDEVTLEPEDGIEILIDKLENSRFLFVRDGDQRVEGIVTRYDLNSLPVYGHLYDRFSEFEIGLRELLRRRVPNWHDRSDEHVPHRGKHNVVQDRLSCAELGTLIKLVDEFDLISELPVAESLSLSALRRLRNDVAHYVPIVHTMLQRPTLDETIRGAPQLASEYHYLIRCIDWLNRG